MATPRKGKLDVYKNLTCIDRETDNATVEVAVVTLSPLKSSSGRPPKKYPNVQWSDSPQTTSSQDITLHQLQYQPVYQRVNSEVKVIAVDGPTTLQDGRQLQNSLLCGRTVYVLLIDKSYKLTSASVNYLSFPKQELPALKLMSVKYALTTLFPLQQRTP